MIRMIAENSVEHRSAEQAADQAWSGNSADLIDALSVALCVVDKDLQVVRANNAAQLFVGSDRPSGFRNLLDRSVGVKPALLRKQIIQSVCAGGQTSIILRASKFEPLICSVRTLWSDGRPYGLVSITSLTGGSKATIPSLRGMYKLSKAEAEIATAAAAGMEVIDMAATRNVSIHTLRTQIASIKAKMGLSRMTEIAVAVCRIEAAVTWL